MKYSVVEVLRGEVKGSSNDWVGAQQGRVEASLVEVFDTIDEAKAYLKSQFDTLAAKPDCVMSCHNDIEDRELKAVVKMRGLGTHCLLLLEGEYKDGDFCD